MGFFYKTNPMSEFLAIPTLSWQGQLGQAGTQNPTLATNSNSSNRMDWSFLGNVADALPQVIGQFNGKFQNNQLAIAEANARAAEAQAQATTAQPRNNTIVWVVAIIAMLIIAFLLMRKK